MTLINWDELTKQKEKMRQAGLKTLANHGIVLQECCECLKEGELHSCFSSCFASRVESVINYEVEKRFATRRNHYLVMALIGGFTLSIMLYPYVQYFMEILRNL